MILHKIKDVEANSNPNPEMNNYKYSQNATSCMVSAGANSQ